MNKLFINMDTWTNDVVAGTATHLELFKLLGCIFAICLVCVTVLYIFGYFWLKICDELGAP